VDMYFPADRIIKLYVFTMPFLQWVFWPEIRILTDDWKSTFRFVGNRDPTSVEKFLFHGPLDSEPLWELFLSPTASPCALRALMGKPS